MPFLPRMISQANERTTTPVSSGNTAATMRMDLSQPGARETT